MKPKPHSNKIALKNIHPGEVLRLDFLEPMEISAYRLAKETGIPESRISEIIHGKRGVSADPAIRLSRFFGTSPDLWMGLQKDYDLEEAEKVAASEYNKIKKFDSVSA